MRRRERGGTEKEWEAEGDRRWQQGVQRTTIDNAIKPLGGSRGARDY